MFSKFKSITDEELDFDLFTKWKATYAGEYNWFYAGNSKTQKAIVVRFYSDSFEIEISTTAFVNVQSIENEPATKEEFLNAYMFGINRMLHIHSMLLNHKT